MCTPTVGVGGRKLPLAEAGMTSPIYILNHTVNNHDACHYGDVIQNTHMIQQNVQAAVVSTMNVAEERHMAVIHEVVDSANQALASQLSETTRRTNEVLDRQARDFACMIDMRSQEDRVKAEAAHYQAAQRDLAARAEQSVLAAAMTRVKELELELQLKDEVAAEFAKQRERGSQEVSATLRQWAANRSDNGTMNSALSESGASQRGALASLAHHPLLENTDGCGHKITSSGLPLSLIHI